MANTGDDAAAPNPSFSLRFEGSLLDRGLIVCPGP